MHLRNINKPIHFCLLILWLCLGTLSAQQILVAPAAPGLDESTGEVLNIEEYFAYNLAGPGVTIDNVSISGPPDAYGYFYTAPDNVTIPNFTIPFGVVMSTGCLEDVPGPNSGIVTGTACGGGTGEGDADLTDVSGVPTNDAVILEFQITPTGNLLSFEYIFASEEYDQYVCSNFNDVFAFFITGPDPNDPANDYDKLNIALIPGTNLPVAISTVNDGVSDSNAGSICELDYSEFYDGEIPELEFEGKTVTLPASVEVVPCETYTLKLAIADGQDNILDSAVFLKANSFTSPQPDLDLAGGYELYLPDTLDSDGNQIPIYQTNGAVNGVVFEGCNSKDLFFSIAGIETDADFTLDLEITGTAINGVDYYDLDGNPIPTTFTLSQDNPTDTITIIADADGSFEGAETMIVSIVGLNGVNCILDFDAVTDTIFIVDNILEILPSEPAVKDIISFPVACQTVTYVIFEPLTWSPDSIERFPPEPFLIAGSDPNSTAFEDSIAQITETTQFGYILINGPCRDTILLDPVVVTQPVLPSPPVIDDFYGICTNDPIAFDLPTNDVLYSWSPNTGLTCYDCPDPVFTPTGSSATYDLYVQYAGGCLDTTYTILIDYDNPQFLTGPIDPIVICSGETYDVQIDGGMTYEWSPTTGLSCSDCPNPTIDSPAETIVYTVSSENEFSCSDSFEVEIQGAASIANAGPDFENCVAIEDLMLGPDSPNPTFTYTWDPPFGLDDPSAANPMLNIQANPGENITQTYTLTVESPDGCLASSQVTVLAQGTPQIQIAQEDSMTIVQGSTTTLSATGLDVNGTYEWYPKDGLSNSNNAVISARPLTSTTYFVVGSTALGCEEMDSIHIEVIEPPRVLLPSAFSPNGDGLHDLFGMSTKDVAEILSFQIFNRWGEMVYNGPPSIDAKWDGTHDGEFQNMGVYMYMVQYRFEGALQVQSVVGNVTLIR